MIFLSWELRLTQKDVIVLKDALISIVGVEKWVEFVLLYVDVKLALIAK